MSDVYEVIRNPNQEDAQIHCRMEPVHQRTVAVVRDFDLAHKITDMLNEQGYVPYSTSCSDYGMFSDPRKIED